MTITKTQAFNQYQSAQWGTFECLMHNAVKANPSDVMPRYQSSKHFKSSLIPVQSIKLVSVQCRYSGNEQTSMGVQESDTVVSQDSCWYNKKKRMIHWARKTGEMSAPTFFSDPEEKPVTRWEEWEKWGGGLIKAVRFVVLSPCTLLSLALHISLLSPGGSGDDGENEWRGREWERLMRHGYRAFAWRSISMAYYDKDITEMVTHLILFCSCVNGKITSETHEVFFYSELLIWQVCFKIIPACSLT